MRGTPRSSEAGWRLIRGRRPVAVSTAARPGTGAGREGMWSRVTAALWRRPWARATMLLTPPLAWFVLIYLAALAVLLVTAFWQINPFTTNRSEEHTSELQSQFHFVCRLLLETKQRAAPAPRDAPSRASPRRGYPAARRR